MLSKAMVGTLKKKDLFNQKKVMFYPGNQIVSDAALNPLVITSIPFDNSDFFFTPGSNILLDLTYRQYAGYSSGSIYWVTNGWFFIWPFAIAMDHSENGVSLKLEYSIDSGLTWNVHFETGIYEGRSTCAITATAGDIHANNAIRLGITRSFLLTGISGNKVRFRLSAKGVRRITSEPHSSGTCVQTVQNNSHDSWFFASDIATLSHDGKNHFKMHASLTEVKPNS